jgi:ubiquitin-like modifier-activating enzyme ATG7
MTDRLISVRAPAPAPQAISQGDIAELAATSGSILGLVPHQLRGFLAQFRSVPITGAAYDRCTGCSETVGFDHLDWESHAELRLRY